MFVGIWLHLCPCIRLFAVRLFTVAFSIAKQVNMKIFYKAKNGKTVSLEINPEETVKQVIEKIQDKGGIRSCNISLT